MKLQWHPASGKRQVFSLEFEEAGQRRAAAVLALAGIFLAALPLSLSTVLVRWRRRAADEEVAMLNARRHEALQVATSGLRETDDRLASDRDLLLRVSFLYDLPSQLAAGDPLAGSAAQPEDRLSATELELGLLSRSVAVIRDAERAHPDWASVTPSITPVPEASFVVADPFGWRLSRLTGQSEFSMGVAIAAPRGESVFATADGVVRWAGPFPLRVNSPYGHLGRIVAIKHGDRAVTVYGNLESVAVSRGSHLRRGDRLGTVGLDRFVGAPRLRYETWKIVGGEAVPVDPSIAMLNYPAADVPGIIKKAGAKRASQNLTALPAEFR